MGYDSCPITFKKQVEDDFANWAHAGDEVDGGATPETAHSEGVASLGSVMGLTTSESGRFRG